VKKYKTGYCQDKLIDKVEIIRETDKSVFIERYWFGKKIVVRESKRSECDNYFNTWKEAHKYLMEKAERRLRHSKGTYDMDVERLNQISNLKEI